MDGYQAYQYYLPVRLHFTKPKFDLFKIKPSQTKIWGSRSAFEHRCDSGLIRQLGRRVSNPQELVQFLVSNFGYGNKDILYTQGIEAEQNYIKWLRTKSTISKVFFEDCEKIDPLLTQEGFVSGGFPGIIQEFISNRINIESVCIIDSLMDLSTEWLNNPLLMSVAGDHVWRMRKLTPFVKYDRSVAVKPVKHIMDSVTS